MLQFPSNVRHYDTDLRGGDRISTRHRKGPSSEAKDYSLPDDCDVTLSREKSRQKILSTRILHHYGCNSDFRAWSTPKSKVRLLPRFANLSMQGGEIRGGWSGQ